MKNRLIKPRDNKTVNFINYLLPLYPILAQYKGPIISIGVTIMLLYSVIVLFKRKKITLYRPFIAFSLFAVIMQFVNGLILPRYITTYNNGNLLFMVVVIFIIVSTWGLVDITALYRTYKIIGIVVIFVASIQFFQLYILKQNVYPWAFIDITGEKFWYTYGNRPTAFFAEPQALCSFLLPLLFLSLKKKENWLSGIIILAAFLSTSSLGIIISLMMVGVNVFVVNRNKLAKIIAGFVMLFSSVLLLFNIGSVQSSYIIQKIMNINLSDDVRLARGFQIYNQFTLENKLIGVGSGNLPNYLLYLSDIRFDWMNLVRQDSWGYANAVASSLLSFGVLGGLLFIYFILSLRKYCSKEIIPMYLCILLLIITTSILLDSWFIFFFVFFFGVLIEEGKIKTYVLKI